MKAALYHYLGAHLAFAMTLGAVAGVSLLLPLEERPRREEKWLNPTWPMLVGPTVATHSLFYGHAESRLRPERGKVEEERSKQEQLNDGGRPPTCPGFRRRAASPASPLANR